MISLHHSSIGANKIFALSQLWQPNYISSCQYITDKLNQPEKNDTISKCSIPDKISMTDVRANSANIFIRRYDRDLQHTSQ
jgi:hypothetical protein